MSNDLRGLVIRKILALKSIDNFSPSLMRWKTAYTTDGQHLSNVDFTKCSDDELVEIFELVVKRYYKQC